MRTHHLARVGAPALLLGLVSVGCTPDARPTAASASAPKADRHAARRTAEARAAIKTGDAARAVAAAEQAVALRPRDAGGREMLGQAYLIAGRFTSAEASFADAVALDPTPRRASFDLAIARIALGKWELARASLAQLEGIMPDTDVGLALALAGDKEGAIVLLERAARAEGATAKARQNLALGYALSGQWAEAQTVAAQDLPGNQILVRIAEWSRFARPQTSWDQVASLLGVTAVEDPGQPVALALGEVPGATTALAAASVPAPDAATMIAQADAVAPVATGEAAPVAVAAAVPPRVAAPPIATVRSASRSAVRRVAVPAATPAAPRSGGQWVVQLGAYSQPAALETAWARVSSRLLAVRGYAPARSTFSVGGAGTLYRLTMSGFATRNDAQRLCAQIRVRSGACFVRAAFGERPLQWAARTNTFFAMR
jgi:Flp pilus assembly protein TadD